MPAPPKHTAGMPLPLSRIAFVQAIIAGCLGLIFCVVASLADDDDSSPQPRIEHQLREVEGWTVHVDARLLDGESKQLGDLALRVLGNKLYEIATILPEARVHDLRAVPIWLDLDHRLAAMQYHPSAGWLEGHGYDPAMAKAVHIPQAERFVRLAQTNHQPSVVLHELAHAYHDRVLGFDHRPIVEEYRRVVKEGLFESTLHIKGRKTRHYALTDHKEYFAEMTECYFGANDFYPFVRAELKDCDPGTFALLETIWGPLP